MSERISTGSDIKQRREGGSKYRTSNKGRKEPLRAVKRVGDKKERRKKSLYTNRIERERE